jgi:hypothetical protein
VKPAGARGEDVRDVLADRAQIGRCAQGKLFVGERPDRLDEKVLVRLPAFVKRQQVGLFFGHEYVLSTKAFAYCPLFSAQYRTESGKF